jgi:uncharacterized protein (DUF58 family)
MSEFNIGRRELYILPTRIGWYFALILIALFGIAVKFDNQAAFMMLFILVSLALIAMVYTHNNVIGLTLQSQPSNAVFLGTQSVFPIKVNNSSSKSRQAVWVISGGHHQLASLEPNSLQSIELKLPTLQRGYLSCDPISLSSQYPLGIFFCWTKRFVSEERCLVYPQPLNLIDFPEQGSHDGLKHTNNSVKAGAEDYSGMKSYQQGDRLRDIHWPSLAKTNKLVSIQYESHSNSSVNLSWFALPNTLNTEDKLSQLCYWLVDAEENGQQYQLEMPNNTIEYDSGMTHYHNCLRVLALWGDEHYQAEIERQKASTNGDGVNNGRS